MKITRSIIFAVVLLFSLTVAVQVFAELTMKEYREIKKSKIGFDFLTSYLGGYLSGITWANVSLIKGKRLPIYCIPENLALNSQNLMQMLEEEYEKGKSKYKDDFLIGPILLFAFTHTFPCK